MPAALPTRCPWVKLEPLSVAYHDDEWGVPVRDDRKLFEMIVLEGFQAGLSWMTILRRREAFRRAFDRFDPGRIAGYRPAKVAALLQDPHIIRSRAKIEATVDNARAFLRLREEAGSFDAFVWRFVGGVPVVNHWRRAGDVPARTAVSSALSQALRDRGFTFVGPTICYAFMQAVGMVNDHLLTCFRHRELSGSASRHT